MNKKFFIFLQEIANINDKLDIQTFFKIKSVVEESNFFEDINLTKELEEKLLSQNIDNSIIECFKDNTIKEKTNLIYCNLKKLKFKVYTLLDYYTKSGIEYKFKIPFCIISTKDIDLNSKKIYIYYSKYYTNFAKKIITYFSKVITQESAIATSIFEDEYTFNFKIINFEDLANINGNKILVSNNKYIEWLTYVFIDLLIIIEARYESKIVNLVENYIAFGKDIYVVPSNIFRKNGYFSNYLIKQGADIILNGQDIKFLLKKNMR